MKLSMMAAAAVAVWGANVGVTAVAVYGLEHQRAYEPSADTWRPSVEAQTVPKQLAEESEAAESEGAIEMPMDTIVGHNRGTAEMQAAPHVTIGPGTVTHPSSVTPRPSR